MLFLTRDYCVFIRYNLLKGCYEWSLIQPWTQVIDYSLPGLTWHTRLRFGISHLCISGIVVHGRCYISYCFYFSVIFFLFCYVLWLLVGWSLFFVFVFMSPDSSLSSQESILTYLPSFWLITKLYHFYYGSVASCYNILLNWIIVDYLSYYVMIIYLVLFLLVPFYFHFYSSISFFSTIQILFDLMFHLLF